MRKGASGHGKNQSKATRRPFHEIPNPQVLDAAKQFRSGFHLMMQQPPFSGVLLPALHCASVALELYLKSLSAREVEIPDTVLAGGAYIHAQSTAKSHWLEDLFEQAPPDIQQLIEEASGRFPRLRRFSGVRKALKAHNPIFMASRYPFEPSSELNGVEIEALDELLRLLDDAISETPCRWVPDTP